MKKALSIRQTYMERLSYSDQVRLFFITDIVLGAHGTAMTNCIFLLPHTVLIECNPPFFYDANFFNIAYQVQVFYICVPSYPNVTEKDRQAIEYYEEGIFFSNRRPYVQAQVSPNMNQVLYALEDALAYTRRWRFSFSVVDSWSPIFPLCVCLDMRVFEFDVVWEGIRKSVNNSGKKI